MAARNNRAQGDIFLIEVRHSDGKDWSQNDIPLGHARVSDDGEKSQDWRTKLGQLLFYQTNPTEERRSGISKLPDLG
jgi:hypothetical protein